MGSHGRLLSQRETCSEPHLWKMPLAASGGWRGLPGPGTAGWDEGTQAVSIATSVSLLLSSSLSSALPIRTPVGPCAHDLPSVTAGCAHDLYQGSLAPASFLCTSQPHNHGSREASLHSPFLRQSPPFLPLPRMPTFLTAFTTLEILLCALVCGLSLDYSDTQACVSVTAVSQAPTTLPAGLWQLGVGRMNGSTSFLNGFMESRIMDVPLLIDLSIDGHQGFQLF